MPVTNGPAAEAKVAAGEYPQIDDRVGAGYAADDEADAGERRDRDADFDCIITEPIPARSFLENVIQASKAQRHQDHAKVVTISEKPQVRLVDSDQDGNQQHDQHAGHDVDVEQPMP
jgi:hypothetical protein